MWGSLSRLSRVTDSSPLCLCVSMGNGAVSLSQRPWGYPSVSGGCGGEGVCGMCHLKTNGQEVQPEKQQYLQNIYSEKSFRPRYFSDFNKPLDMGCSPDQ